MTLFAVAALSALLVQHSLWQEYELGRAHRELLMLAEEPVLGEPIEISKLRNRGGIDPERFLIDDLPVVKVCLQGPSGGCILEKRSATKNETMRERDALPPEWARMYAQPRLRSDFKFEAEEKPQELRFDRTLEGDKEAVK